MPTQKIDPKVIFASDAPAIDKPPVFSDKTKGWDVARANDGRPQIKEMNKMQQDTDLKILWLNENAVLPYDLTIDYPDGAVTLKDGSFKQLSSGSWVEFLDDFADKDAVKRGIANRYDSSLTYNSGERVVLANGDIVKSTIDGNTNDPNVDMTGWVQSGLIIVDSVSKMIEIPAKNGLLVETLSYYQKVNFLLTDLYKGGAKYVFVETLSNINDGFSCIDGWVLIPQNNTITPEQAGAFSDGINDDTIGCRKAIEYAYTIGLTVEFMSNATYIVNDKLLNVDESASTVASTKSFTLKGNNCRMKLGGLAGDFIITVILPSVAQNNNKFTIQDFFFYTDNITRPSVLYFKNASWISISNTVFFQTWIGAKFEFGLRNDVNNCSFWGNYVGAHYHKTRDSAVSKTHAYGCEKGLLGTGDSDVATDGNLSINDFTANDCSDKGVELAGLYTPQLNNVIVEHCATGIDYRSCQFGHLSNLFIGPCNNYSFYSDKSDSGLSNDYTQINNLNVQNESVLRYLNFSQVSNISAQGVNSSNTNSAIYVTNSQELDVINPKVRDSSVYNSILVETDASDINIHAGSVNKNITFLGNSSGSVEKILVGEDVVMSEAAALKSNVDYQKIKNGVRYTVDKINFKSGSIGIGNSTTVLISDFCRGLKSNIIVTAGVNGSLTIAEIDIIFNGETIVASIVANAGNRGSALIEIVDSNTLACAVKITATAGVNINYNIFK